MRRLALIAATGIVLAGCGGSGYPIVDHSPRLMAFPPGAHQLHDPVQFVSPTRLEIETWGSTTCPGVPDELVILGRHAIQVHVGTGSWINGKIVAHPPPGGVCTLDLMQSSMVIAIDPKEIDVHRRLTVSLFYDDGGKPEVHTAPPLTDG